MYPRTKLPCGIKPLNRNESWLSVPTEVADDREVGQKKYIRAREIWEGWMVEATGKESRKGIAELSRTTSA